MNAAPESLVPLAEFLESQNFERHVDVDEPMVFGDQRFRWTRHDMRVQVSLDRGRWFVDVLPTSAADWFGYGLEIVVDTLDDADRFTPLLTLRQATAIIKDRLDEISDLLSTAEGRYAIESAQHERARRWFGA
jgi:hypothetical protein